jgi:hypothetical protein
MEEKEEEKEMMKEKEKEEKEEEEKQKGEEETQKNPWVLRVTQGFCKCNSLIRTNIVAMNFRSIFIFLSIFRIIGAVLAVSVNQ